MDERMWILPDAGSFCPNGRIGLAAACCRGVLLGLMSLARPAAEAFAALAAP
jgi:hypothetical protein